MYDSGTSQAIQLLNRENARLKDRIEALEAENAALQSYIQGISALYDATLNIVVQDDVMQLLDEILYQALMVINAEHGSILLVDEETQELVFVLVHGQFREALQGHRVDWDQGIAGWAFQQNSPVIVNDVASDSRFYGGIDAKLGMTSENLIAVPMTCGRRTLGVIELVNKRDRTEFSDSDATILSLLAVFAATTLDQLERQLEETEEAG